MSPVDFDDARADAIAGQGVAVEAERLRKALRRRYKPDDTRRVDKVTAMIELIDRAMKPIRSHMGRLTWEAYPSDVEQALTETSGKLQYNRRQLKKMLRR